MAAGGWIAGGMAACSLVTSLDGLTGGAPGAGTDALDASVLADAAVGADVGPAAAAGDAGEDAVGIGGETGEDDATAPPDGGADARTGVPADAATDAPRRTRRSPEAASSGGYCASLSAAPLFCDDFDEGALATPWDQITHVDGTETLNGAFYTSPPNALLAGVTAESPSASIDVAAYKSFPAEQGVAATWTLAFDFRIDAADTSSNSDSVLAAIQLWNGSAAWDLELEVSYVAASGDFSASMTEDSPEVDHAASAHLKMSAWTRVALSIALPVGSGGATPATLSFDGAVVASATVHVSTTDPIPEIVLGATYATPAAGGWAVRYDDVTFD